MWKPLGEAVSMYCAVAHQIIVLILKGLFKSSVE